MSPEQYKKGSAPDAHGRFGPYGGKFVPETLMAALAELEDAYKDACQDPEFKASLDFWLRTYAGRPTPQFHAVSH